MLSLIKDWKGKVEIDGVEYESIQDATKRFKSVSGDVHIILKSNCEIVLNRATDGVKQTIAKSDDEKEYRITVKKYMTEQATPSFDFMAKWNDNKPMPMRIMTGTVEKETRGMVYMNLHGEGRETITCMCCGKELTNPVSRHYGIGPICMSKVGIHCDISNVDEIKEKLVDIKWSGWLIKSAIIEREEV